MIKKLNATNSLWVNGTFPVIDLPADAKPAQVVAAAVTGYGLDCGRFAPYRFATVRRVELYVPSAYGNIDSPAPWMHTGLRQLAEATPNGQIAWSKGGCEFGTARR